MNMKFEDIGINQNTIINAIVFNGNGYNVDELLYLVKDNLPCIVIDYALKVQQSLIDKYDLGMALDTGELIITRDNLEIKQQLGITGEINLLAIKFDNEK